MNRMSMEQLLHDQSFLSSLLSLLKEEEKLCKDVHRLTAIINVSLGLMGGSEKDKVQFVLRVPGMYIAVFILISLFLHYMCFFSSGDSCLRL